MTSGPGKPFVIESSPVVKRTIRKTAISKSENSQEKNRTQSSFMCTDLAISITRPITDRDTFVLGFHHVDKTCKMENTCRSENELVEHVYTRLLLQSYMIKHVCIMHT